MSVTTIIHGSSGKTSMLRVAILFITSIVMMVFLSHNIISLFNGGGFVSMGYQEVLVLSVSLIVKVAQRYIEGIRVLDTGSKES